MRVRRPLLETRCNCLNHKSKSFNLILRARMHVEGCICNWSVVLKVSSWKESQGCIRSEGGYLIQNNKVIANKYNNTTNKVILTRSLACGASVAQKDSFNWFLSHLLLYHVSSLR